MLRLFDYIFYHGIRINTDDNDEAPSLLEYISGILSAAFPLWFNIIALSIWLQIVPEDIDHRVQWNYYFIIAAIIVIFFAFRYGPRRYKMLLEKWGDRAKTTKSKLLILGYVLGSFFVGLISLDIL